MMVMPGDNTGLRIGYLAGRFPGRLGHLHSPRPGRLPPGPFEFMPYALDNGAFAAGSEWRHEPWLNMLEWARVSGQRPLWALVPDVWSDREGTLRQWRVYAHRVARYGWPLAFAVQDGMKPSDVPRDASVIFIGGTNAWRQRTIRMWCAEFPRVHVGRVNSYRALWFCHEAGAESCDGTGWTRGDHGSGKPWRAILSYLEEATGQRARHVQLHLEVA